MARFTPVYTRRSDGKLEVVGHHRKVEKNEPTPEQLDRTPDANGVSDYYREIGIDEQKHLDWRRKLGGLLARALGAAEKGDVGYILVTFPENYRLYEHVKRAEGEGQGIKSTKTHAGGGNERQDAYLYGHPLGRKKRFRSPADFYPHLLWLCTDEAGDLDNCTCKICCPEELQETRPVQPKKEVVSEPAIKTIKSEPTAPAREQQVLLDRQPTPRDAQPRQVATPGLTPAPSDKVLPYPGPVTEDQAVDFTYGTFLYRQGELVWFTRGQAWGLALVIRRWKQGNVVDINAERKYNLQPLSPPHSHPPQVTVSGEDSLRPFLVWTTPGFTHRALNEINGVHYDTMDWNGVRQGKYGAGDLEIDGSILAAKKVDPTVTTIGNLGRQELQPGLAEIRWNGIYLGCEKIWVSDIIRLRSSAATDVMVVREIVERARTSAFNQAVLERSLHVVGDLYSSLTIAQADRRQAFPAGFDRTNLPHRLVEDLRQRNFRSIATRGVATIFKLSRPSVKVDTRDIKGRWYEATLLNPILTPDQWEKEFQKGEVIETGLRMNSRLDCSAIKGQIAAQHVRELRKSTRQEAFGLSIPEGLQIVDGNKAPQQNGVHLQSQHALPHSAQQSHHQSHMVIDPAFTHVSDHQQSNGGALEEFMDLDSMDTGQMSGFGQEHGSQGY